MPVRSLRGLAAERVVTLFEDEDWIARKLSVEESNNIFSLLPSAISALLLENALHLLQKHPDQPTKYRVVINLLHLCCRVSLALDGNTYPNIDFDILLSQLPSSLRSLRIYNAHSNFNSQWTGVLQIASKHEDSIKFVRLKRLAVGACGIFPDGWLPNVLRTLVPCQHLKVLSISNWSQLVDADLQHIWQSCNNLKELNVSGCINLTCKAFRQPSDMKEPAARNLRALNISWLPKLTSKIFKKLILLLSCGTESRRVSLGSFEMAGCPRIGLTDGRFAKFVELNPLLAKLDLSYRLISSTESFFPLEVISTLKHLRCLNLEETQGYLYTDLFQSGYIENLEVLNLTGAYLAGSYNSVDSPFAVFPKLRRLSVSHLQASKHVLLGLLKDCSTLEELDISYNSNMSSTDWNASYAIYEKLNHKELIKILSHCPSKSLRILNVSGQFDITPEDLERILGIFPELTELSLQNVMHLHQEHLSVLSSATKLEKLDISHCPLLNEMVITEELLSNSTSLRYVDISYSTKRFPADFDWIDSKVAEINKTRDFENQITIKRENPYPTEPVIVNGLILLLPDLRVDAAEYSLDLLRQLQSKKAKIEKGQPLGRHPADNILKPWIEDSIFSISIDDIKLPCFLDIKIGSKSLNNKLVTFQNISGNKAERVDEKDFFADCQTPPSDYLYEALSSFYAFGAEELLNALVRLSDLEEGNEEPIGLEEDYDESSTLCWVVEIGGYAYLKKQQVDENEKQNAEKEKENENEKKPRRVNAEGKLFIDFHRRNYDGDEFCDRWAIDELDFLQQCLDQLKSIKQVIDILLERVAELLDLPDQILMEQMKGFSQKVQLVYPAPTMSVQEVLRHFKDRTPKFEKLASLEETIKRKKEGK